MEGIMRPHPFLRAYMAGIVVPTLVLLVSMTVFACFRFYFEVPSQFVLEMPAWPLARAIVFPMAVVPNVWGLWNMLYLALRSRVRLPLGLHGALLPLFLIPGGVALTRVLDVFTIQLQYALPIIPIGMGIYYLAWRFLVGFLNEEMGID
jgi:hypothetical protein